MWVSVCQQLILLFLTFFLSAPLQAAQEFSIFNGLRAFCQEQNARIFPYSFIYAAFRPIKAS